MSSNHSSLDNWTPEQIALGKKWVQTWQLAGADLECIHRRELRALDNFRAISQLCGLATEGTPLRLSSGLVEQQRWFMKAAGRD